MMCINVWFLLEKRSYADESILLLSVGQIYMKVTSSLYPSSQYAYISFVLVVTWTYAINMGNKTHEIDICSQQLWECAT